MKNIITASIHFSFKGKGLSPSLIIELDPHLEANGKIPDLCSLIATQNGFDLYSYEYEMMQSAEVSFSNAQGLIADFISNNQIQHEAFIKAWQENNALLKLLKITEKHMNISDLSNHTELQQALLAAYELGKNDTQSK